MDKNSQFIIAVMAFLLGVVSYTFFFYGISLFLLGGWWFKKKIPFIWLLIAFLLGWGRGSWGDESLLRVEQPQVLEVVVSDYPRTQNYEVTLVGSILPPSALAGYHVTWQCPADRTWLYGDVITLDGKLTIANSWSQSQHIEYNLQVTSWSSGQSLNSWRRVLNLVRNWLGERFRTLYSREVAAFLASTTLGDGTALSVQQKNDFKQTGLIHITVVSGYHIAVVMGVLDQLGRRWRRRWRLTFVNLGVWLFVFLVGISGATVRAGLMGTIGSLSLAAERQRDSLTALVVSVFLLVLYRPGLLFYDVGLQLSVSATLGIILLYGPFARCLSRWWGGEMLAMTLAAQYFTWPLLGFYFGQISLIGILANLVIVPLVTPLMGLGTLSIFLPNMVGRIIVILTEYFGRFILYLVQVGSLIPVLYNFSLSPEGVIVAYIVLGKLAWEIGRRRSIMKQITQTD